MENSLDSGLTAAPGEVSAGKINTYLQYISHEIDWLSNHAYVHSFEEMSHNEARLIIAHHLIKELSKEVTLLLDTQLPHLSEKVLNLQGPPLA